jgi:capsular exopolysaccharide synthesis family protein
LNTHIQQINSRTFFEYVAATFTQAEIDQILAPYLDSQKSQLEGPAIDLIILENLSVVERRNTLIMEVIIKHRDPEAAALIANRYARRYIDFVLEQSTTGTNSAIIFLQTEEERLSRKVQESDKRLLDYRLQYNLVSLQDDQNVVVSKLNSLAGALTGAGVARLQMETTLSQIKNAQKEGKPLTEINSIATYGTIPEYLKQLDTLQSNKETLEQKYLERHPKIIAIDQSIASTQKLLSQNIAAAVTEIQSSYDKAVQLEESMEIAVSLAEGQSLELDQVNVRYQTLEDKARNDRALYNKILNSLNEATISQQLENVKVNILDHALVPVLPVEPDMIKSLLMASAFGCFLFIGLPLGLGHLDFRLKASWEIEQFLNQTLLGEVPDLQHVKKENRPHLINQEKEHAACEAFRGLFGQIQLNSHFDYPKVLMLTSTIPGEGKSLISSNLAATFAAHGKRTILLDCDFRRPTLHNYYNKPDDHGMIKWINSGSELGDNVEENKFLGILEIAKNFSFLRAGGNSQSPTEFFDLPAFHDLFKKLRDSYDIVLVDTPPIGVFPDALLLSRMCEELIYVCRFNKANRSQIKRFLEKLTQSEVDVAGVILNGLPGGRSSSYYDYYGYGYSDNKSYRAYYSQKR